MRPRRILLLIAAILGPLLAIGIVGLAIEARRQEGRALAEAQAFARSAAHLLSSTLAGTQDEVEEISRLPALARALGAGDQRALEGLVDTLAEDPDLDALVVLAPDGTALVSRGDPNLVAAIPSADRRPLDVSAGVAGGPAMAIHQAPVLLDGTLEGQLVVVEELGILEEVLVQARSRVAPTLVVSGDEVVLGPREWLGRRIRVEESRPPGVRISAGGMLASGVAEPLPATGTGCEVITLLTPALLGPRVSPAALATGAALGLVAAAGTLFWAFRLAKTERRLDRRERELAALREVALEAAVATDRLRPMRVAGRVAAELTGAEESWVVTASDGGAKVLRTHPTPDLEPSPLELAGGPRLARVLRTGRPEAGPGEGPLARSGRPESWTPLVSHGRVLGAVGLSGVRPRREAPEVTGVLDGVAATLASALENHDVLEQLRRQRAMLTRVVESSPDGLVAIDSADRVVLDNPAMRAFFRTEGPTLGLTIDELQARFRESGRRMELDFDFAEALATARAGVTTRGTLRFVDGEATRHGESLMAPLRLPDGENGVLVMLRDVTDRAELAEVRRLHEQVRSVADIAERRAALLESVLGASEVGFVFVDHDGILGYVTELATRLLRLDVLPKGLPLRVLEDMIAARTEDDVTGLLERGGPLRLSGEPRRFLALHVSEVRATNGRSLGRLVSVRDETAQRELELARDEFLGVAAHELKNPLAALRLQAELGLRGHHEKKADALEKIGRKARELTELVERLLDVTRADLGRLVTELTRVDVADLAADVAEGFQGGAAEIRISSDAEAEVIGDPTRIRQVVSNLLSNAVRYAGDRGPIDVAVRRTGDEVRVSVRDRGPGIAPAERAQIFERFGQGRRGKRGPGLGIGLYLARRIAEEHGGRIELEAEVGRGSTFTLVLPALAADRPAVPEHVH